MLGAGFVGAAFVFGVAFEIDSFGEACQCLCEACWGEGAVVLPRCGIDRDVHARLGEDHIAEEVFVRQFVVALLFAVGRAEGGLDHRIGVPREDGHRERE